MTTTSSVRRAAIYVRVSKDRTGDETTTQRQEADCRSLCKLKTWPIARVYRDTDLSAYDVKVTRPEFERLKADLAAGRVDAVVIWKLDRLARRVRDVTDILDLLEERGVPLASVQDSFDTSTPFGRGMVQMAGTMAEIASAETSLRVLRGKLEEAKEGRNPRGGNLPFGWKVEEVERNGKTVRVSSRKVDPKEARALREAALRFLKNEKLMKIARDMQRRGLKTPATKTCPNGKPINSVSLRNMLANPRLAGYRTHRPNGNGKGEVSLYRAEWKPIIDDDTFTALQERFHNEVITTEEGAPQRLIIGRSERARVSGERHLLTGMMWCGSCGDERMRRLNNKKNGDRYVCRFCASITIKRSLIEDYVRDEALTVLMGRRMLGDDHGREDAAALDAQLGELRRRLRDLANARFVDGRIDDDEFEDARAALHDRIAGVEGRLAQARELEIGPEPGTPFEGFRAWWDGASAPERRRVLEGAIRRITVQPYTHELAALFRRPGVVVDESRPVLTGVPMERRDDLSKARVTIEWRPEVVPPALVDAGEMPKSAELAGVPR